MSEVVKMSPAEVVKMYFNLKEFGEIRKLKASVSGDEWKKFVADCLASVEKERGIKIELIEM